MLYLHVQVRTAREMATTQTRMGEGRGDSITALGLTMPLVTTVMSEAEGCWMVGTMAAVVRPTLPTVLHLLTTCEFLFFGFVRTD